MVAWTLNELKKTVEQTFIPGSPGVPGNPGQLATPGYTYTTSVTVSGGQEISATPPLYEQVYELGEGSSVSSRGYQFFGGRKALLSGVLINGASLLYIYTYESTTVTTRIVVPAQPAIPPTPAIPSTPAQVAIDYRLGWNSGAVGPTVLVGDAISWRFFEGSVGAAVGVTKASVLQGQTYREMSLGLIAMSGTYSVVVRGVSVTLPAAFNEEYSFSIARTSENLVAAVVNGAVVYELPILGDLIADSSLYSGHDLILDAQYLVGEAGSLTANATLAASSASSAAAIATVTPSFGPGTARGIAGASTNSGMVIGSVRVNGTVITWCSANTISGAEAAAFITRTFGAGTALGLTSAKTKSDADVALPAGSGGGTIENGTGNNNGNPAEIFLSGVFTAGSTVTVTYTTDGGGTSTVVYTVLVDSTAEQVANELAALLDAQADITAESIGGGAITITPSGGSTTVTIDELDIYIYIDSGSGGGFGISTNGGSADLAFRPIIAAGAAPDVYVSWTGDYAGDSVKLLPMDVESENGDIIPSTAIGAAIMVPMTSTGQCLVGETTVSSMGYMYQMLALGSENEYAEAVLSLLPAYLYASTGETALGSAYLVARFSIYAVGLERDQSGAIMRARNLFGVDGYGGGQIKIKASFTLEAEGSGEGVGRMVGVIGYA